jgi:RNA polymerase sigma factor (sigma-70 family)
MGFRFATYAKWWVLHGIRSALKRFNESQGMQQAPTAASEAPESAADGQCFTLRDPETATAGQTEGPTEAADPEQEPPQLAQLNQRRTLLKRALEKLSERERLIISARYALTEEDEQTLAMLAERFNLSIERVRQIERAALQKLGQTLGELGVSADCLF